MWIGAKIPDIKSVAPEGVIRRGDKGLRVKLVQEWLTLHDYSTAIDGDFGPATQAALWEFRRGTMLTTRLSEDSLGENTWQALWSSMYDVLYFSEFGLSSSLKFLDNLGKVALICANKCLKNNVSEIGQNQGPWVRLFFSRDSVNGLDGPEFSWCGAFVRFCIQQAIELLNYNSKSVWGYKVGWSCDKTAEWASKKGILYTKVSPNTVKPGSVFLLKYSNKEDWYHMGFVESCDYNEGVVTTIEGNTNVAGSREGIKVMRRFRSVKNMNFITGYGKSKVSKKRSLIRVLYQPSLKRKI